MAGKFFKNLFGRQISHGSDVEDPQDLSQAMDQVTLQNQLSFEDDQLQSNVIDETPGKVEMKSAYEVSNRMLRERLAKEDPENEKLLADVSESDIVVVTGTYDHIHLVLDAVGLPYKSVDRASVASLDLRPEQTVYVNCPSSFPREGALKLEKFVKAGGQLITTDWALLHVIEPAFPKTIAYNKRATGDDVVGIEIVDKEDDILKGFLEQKSDAKPQWWLECSSYPIKVLDKKKVKVLVKSDELKRKYGDDPVIVSFEWGEGVVYHMISHFYLQRSETRTKKHEGTVMDYAMDQDLSEENMAYFAEAQTKTPQLNYGMVQSAYTSCDFVSRGVLKQKRKAAAKFSEKK